MACLGVALVVDDIRKGPKLAFTYPLSAAALAGAAGRPSDGGGGDDAATAAADYFARLFRPKTPNLLNKPFIVGVDEVLFISFPVSVAPDAPRGPASSPGGPAASASAGATASGGAASQGSSVSEGSSGSLVSVEPQSLDVPLGEDFDFCLESVGLGRQAAAVATSVGTQPPSAAASARGHGYSLSLGGFSVPSAGGSSGLASQRRPTAATAGEAASATLEGNAEGEGVVAVAAVGGSSGASANSSSGGGGGGVAGGATTPQLLMSRSGGEGEAGHTSGAGQPSSGGAGAAAPARAPLSMFNVVFVVSTSPAAVAAASARRGDSGSGEGGRRAPGGRHAAAVERANGSTAGRGGAAVDSSTNGQLSPPPTLSSARGAGASTNPALAAARQYSPQQLRRLATTAFTAAVQRLTACLVYEEGRCHYVSTQAEALLKSERPAAAAASSSSSSAGAAASHADAAAAAGVTAQGAQSSPLVMASSSASSPPSGQWWGGWASLESMMTALGKQAATEGAGGGKSGDAANAQVAALLTTLYNEAPGLRHSLGWELAFVYHCLRGGVLEGASCHLQLNGWLTCSLSLHPGNAPPSLAALTLPGDLDAPYHAKAKAADAAAVVVTTAPQLDDGSLDALLAAIAGGDGAVEAEGARSSHHHHHSHHHSHHGDHQRGGAEVLGRAAGAWAAAASSAGAAGATDATSTTLGDVARSAAAAAAPPEVAPAASSRQQLAQHELLPIRPYHTLLLVKGTSEVLSSLPPDASPQLAMLVRAASPLKSFNELQGEMGIPSSQLLRLAAHLVHWGLALIINCITQHSMYSVDPTANLAVDSGLAREFEALFGHEWRAGALGGGGGGGEESGGGEDSGSSGAMRLGQVLSLFSRTIGCGSASSSSPTAAATSAVSASAYIVPQGEGYGTHGSIAGGAGVGGMRHVPTHLALGAGGSSSGGATGRARAGSGSARPLGLPPAPTFVRLYESGSILPLRTLISAMPRAQARSFLHVLTWLLKHRLVREIHTHVYLIWPFTLTAKQRRRAAAAARSGGGGGANGLTAFDPAFGVGSSLFFPSSAATGGGGPGSVAASVPGKAPTPRASPRLGPTPAPQQQHFTGGSPPRPGHHGPSGTTASPTLAAMPGSSALPPLASLGAAASESLEVGWTSFSDAERRYLSAVCRGHPAPLTALCARLVVYLRETMFADALTADADAAAARGGTSGGVAASPAAGKRNRGVTNGDELYTSDSDSESVDGSDSDGSSYLSASTGSDAEEGEEGEEEDDGGYTTSGSSERGGKGRGGGDEEEEDEEEGGSRRQAKASRAATAATTRPRQVRARRTAAGTASSSSSARTDGSIPLSRRLGLRLEEVMWRLKVTRADVLGVLAAFPDLFVASIHE